MNIKKKYTIILSILLSIYSIVATSIPFLTSLLVDEAIALYDKKENAWDTLIIVMIAFGAVVLFAASGILGIIRKFAEDNIKN